MTNRADLAYPLVFGFAVLAAWELACRLLSIPTVLLPAPTLIFGKLIS